MRQAHRWLEERVSFEREQDTWYAQREPFAVAVSTDDWHTTASAYENLSEIEAKTGVWQDLQLWDRSLLKEHVARLRGAYAVAIEQPGPGREVRRLAQLARSGSGA